MAVLAKIRQRSFFLIIIIALALFSFVLADLIQSGGFNRESNNVGSVNGEDISFKDFRITVDNVQKNMGNGGSAINAANYVWDEELRRILVKEQYEKLGLRIGKDAILKVMQEDPSIGQNQMFLNDAKQFDKAKFNEYIASIKAMNNEQWTAWLNYEAQVEKIALEKMYFGLINAGIGTTINEAKLSYQFDNDKVDFQYVVYPFSAIKDETVKVTDKEIEDYIKKNDKKFKSDATRGIDFVYIEEKPSSEDIKEVNDKMNTIINGKEVFDAASGTTKVLPAFKDASNVAEFVNANSDVKFDSTYISKADLPPAHAEQIFNLPVNGIYGPFETNGYSYITRMLGKKANSKVKASHILLAYTGAMKAAPTVKRTKEEAKAKADELFAQLNTNQSLFPMLASANSDDSSASNGGDLGFFSSGMMVKPFNDFVFGNPVGKIGVVETEFGYHVIKVTEKQDAIKLATIGVKVEVSESTSDKIYSLVSNFEMKSAEGDFEKTAKSMKLELKKAENIKILDESIAGVGNYREIVKWMFDEATEKGAVKKFNVTNGFVVAKLSNIKVEGLQTAKDAEAIVKPILIKQKKTELAKSKLNGNFEAISKTQGVMSGNALAVNISNALIPNVGIETKVVSTAFNTAIGKESNTIEGINGVYKVKPMAITKAPVLSDYASYISKEKSKRGNVEQPIFTTLKNKADIKDNRHLFY